MKPINWKHVIFFILGLAVMNQFIAYFDKSSTQYGNDKIKMNTPQADTQKIRIVSSSQNAKGITQKNFDTDFLNVFEAYIVKDMKLRSKKKFASQGHANIQVNLKSEAIYVYSGSIKLIVIRVRGSDNSFSVLISGIVGNEFRRVACVRDSNIKIPITYGVCADKIKEIFGGKIGA